MKTIFSKVKLKGRQIMLLSVLVLFAAVAEMMLPSLLAQMINNGVTDSSQSTIFILAAVMAGVTALACIVNFLSVRIASRISTDFSATLRGQIFEKVQNFSAAELDKFGTASLVTRSTSDITNVQNFLTMFLRIGILAPMMAIAGLIFSAATGGQVSSVLTVAIPVLLVGCGIVILFASRYSIKLRQKLDRINQLFLESLEGVRVIRAFNKQKAESHRFGDANTDYAATSMTSGRITSLLLPVINVIFGVTTAAVLGLGAHYVETGAMEVGSLVANSQYISMVLMSVMMLALVIMMFPTAYACAGRMAEVLETETSIQDGSFSFQERPLRSTVEFRHVTFAYPGAPEPILKDVSFEMHPGEITAIIGGTGRGKSSILKLIPRLYDPLFGEVLIDGVNAKEYAVDDLRSLIGYVPQKNVLFLGDIASNLNFGKKDGTEQDWQSAAEIACAEEFILKKENGYHDRIAQGGTNLSGGQRQRMAIARAIMKKPEIYVFDDSFSALDMKTDQTLRKNLKATMGNATIIMVAQRISTILDADRILVVDDEEDLCEILKFNLENEGYFVDTANSAEEALKMELTRYDLLLLDVMMGEISGFKMANMLKKNKATASIPIIFITAKDTENDTVTGFNLGADDYISKPFSLREVIARVKAVLRRTSSTLGKEAQEQLQYKGLLIDITKKKVSINGIEISLTKKEFEILLLLLQNKGRVFSREDILAKVWQEEVYVLDRTIDVNITRLRKKIGEYGKYIVTRLGYGYCFECE